MAIDIGPIAKPQILLVGDVLLSNGNIINYPTGIRVDHSKSLPAASTDVITGKSILNKDDILTFYDSVRVIITGQANASKPTYFRQSGSLGALEFEGANTYSKTGGVNNEAETWYTYNGKDPVRNKAYLYNFLDWDSYSDVINPSGDTNITSLGFVLRNCPTANNLITIKARTYSVGLKSRIAVATFKIAQNDVGEFYQPPE